jgi:glycosyltransferase involved in cell wall biosynthesis
MRIVHVIDVKDDLGGGMEQHVFNLAIAQKARGDSPVVIVPEPGALTAACDEHGIPVAIERRLAGGAMLYDLSIYAETREMTDEAKKVRDETRGAIDDLCTLFTDFGAEVIHSHTSQSAIKAIAAGNRIGIPCVYTNHILKGLRYDKSASLEFAAISVCRSAFEHLKKQGFPEERLYYVPNGTKSVPRAAGESSRPSLIWVGRLENVKGPDIAVLAMADLKRRRGPDCPVLNVYGAGSMEGHLKEMVSVLGLGDVVRFHGVQVGILERCPATDILIVSSRAEAGPLVALEAISRGMPIVAARVGEIEDMLPDRRYGYITLRGSITALADGIESMLSDVRAGRFDPELPISRHQALFTVEKMAERVDAVYKCLT